MSGVRLSGRFIALHEAPPVVKHEVFADAYRGWPVDSVPLREATSRPPYTSLRPGAMLTVAGTY